MKKYFLITPQIYFETTFLTSFTKFGNWQHEFTSISPALLYRIDSKKNISKYTKNYKLNYFCYS